MNHKVDSSIALRSIRVRSILVAVAALTAAAALIAAQRTSTVARLNELAVPLDRTTRLLAIARHSDDEALGAAGLMQRVQARRGTLRVVLLTSGDGFPTSAGTLTKAECRRPWSILHHAEIYQG